MADRGERELETVEWVEAVVGQRVTSVATLPGGMSSIVRRCDLPDGATVVVRDITDRAWLRREPDLISREARALDLLAGTPVTAPRHIASDPAAGRLLMTFLPGSVRITQRGLSSRIEALAALAAGVAAIELPARHGLPKWRSWTPSSPVPPAWGDRVLWEEAIAAGTTRPAPTTAAPTVLHRDLHPLNVLWNRRGSAGLVDWVEACVGHPHAELGHCRWNLSVLVDLNAADAFLRGYVGRRPGDAYDRWWDVDTAIGLLPGPIGTSGWHAVGRNDLDGPAVIAATEAFVRSALESL